MRCPSSIRVGRLLGISIRVHWALLALGGVSIVTGQGWPVVLAFLAVTAHEMAHVTVARSLGLDAMDIELMPFGGRTRMAGLESREPSVEALVASAGPLSSSLLAALTVACRPFIPVNPTLADFFVNVNLGLALFNLLPAGSLDGGRIWRALRASRVGYDRAEREVLRAERALAVMLLVAALVAAVFGALWWQVLLVAGLLYWAGERAPHFAYWAVRDLSTRQDQFLEQPVWVVEDFAVREDARLLDVLEAMRPRHLHRVAVLGFDQRHLGNVWEKDVLAALVEKGPDSSVGELVPRQN